MLLLCMWGDDAWDGKVWAVSVLHVLYQGPAGANGCRGGAIPMGVLDNLIVSHLEDWLLTPEGLADLLGDVLVSQDVHLERLKGGLLRCKGRWRKLRLSSLAFTRRSRWVLLI